MKTFAELTTEERTEMAESFRTSAKRCRKMAEFSGNTKRARAAFLARAVQHDQDAAECERLNDMSQLWQAARKV
jgi:hypothetical protein